MCSIFFFFFFQAEDGIRDLTVTGVQTCALPISRQRGGELRAQDARGRGPAGGPGPETHDPRVGGDRGARVGRPAADRGPLPQPALLPDGWRAETPDWPRGCRDPARAARGSPPGTRCR